MSSLSGIKDVDREILLAMTDKDLLRTCSLNKYLFETICDDNFFYKRLSIKYPNTLPYYTKYIQDKFLSEKDKNYKSYYLRIIYYISKMKEDYHYDYISGNPETQYEIFKLARNNKNKLLYESVRNGELNIVKEAIKRGADIYGDDDFALSIALSKGNLEIVKYLVDQGADVDGLYNFGIEMAKEYGYTELLNYLNNLPETV